MDLSSLEVRTELASRDADFSRLHDEHQACEKRLSELQHKFGLTTDEEVEEKRLKKQKLALRDQMETYIRSKGLA